MREIREGEEEVGGEGDDKDADANPQFCTERPAHSTEPTGVTALMPTLKRVKLLPPLVCTEAIPLRLKLEKVARDRRVVDEAGAKAWRIASKPIVRLEEDAGIKPTKVTSRTVIPACKTIAALDVLRLVARNV